MSILTNTERYGKMVEALNDFYWDNSISPNETAARLDEFAADVARLAKYIRDNDPALDRAAQLQRAAADAGGAVCTCAEFVQSVFDPKRCAVCRKPRLGS